MSRTLCTCLFVVILIGCTKNPTGSASPFTEEQALMLLQKSPTFTKCLARNDRISCLLDDLNDSEAIIDVGVMHPERLEKVHSFRVVRNGKIFVYNPLAAGDDPWVLDFDPPE